MKTSHTRRGYTQANQNIQVGPIVPVNKINCHAEKLLLSIPTVLKKRGRDPEQKLFMMTLSNNGAFTLIELLIVVLIIGILAAVALPQYQKAVVKSRLAAVKLQVATLTNAAEVYYLEHGNYPTKLSELDINILESENAQYDEESARDTVTYPWGYCYLGSSRSQLIQCNNTQVNIGYMQRFVHSISRPNTRACTALNSNSIAITVCKQDTKNDSYYFQGDDGAGIIVESYLYQ